MWYLTDRIVFFVDFNMYDYFFGDEVNEPVWFCKCKYSYIGQKIIIVLFIIGMLVTFFIDVLLIPFYLLYKVLGCKKLCKKQNIEVTQMEPKDSVVIVKLTDLHEVDNIV